MKNSNVRKLDPTNPRVELMDITPQMAVEWLNKMGGNRTLSRRIVDRYARDMTADKWRLTGDAIRLDKAGCVRDGQHRLRAIVASGITIRSYVFFGIDEDAVTVIDTGKKRSPGDMLKMRGVENPLRVAATARWLLSIKYGFANVKSRTYVPTTTEIDDVLDRHLDLGPSCSICDTTKGIISPSLLAALHYCGVQMLNKPDEAHAFVTTFTKGISNREFYDTPQEDAAWRWRERLIAFRTPYARPDAHVFNGTVEAWNRYAKHEVIGRSMIVPKDTPTIEGLNLDDI